jgi:hypothetical protein
METGAADSAWNERELELAEFMAGRIFGRRKGRKIQAKIARHTN